MHFLGLEACFLLTGKCEFMVSLLLCMSPNGCRRYSELKVWACSNDVQPCLLVTQAAGSS